MKSLQKALKNARFAQKNCQNRMEKKQVTIYTDGACSGNPGIGGWASILIYNNFKKELSGGELETTNNRMELMAIIKGLSALNSPCNVSVYSDSAYAVNAFQENWIAGWQKNNWKNSSKKDVKNIDLWLQLIELCKIHTVTFFKVKGHANNVLNNRCDELAVSEVKKLQLQIQM